MLPDSMHFVTHYSCIGVGGSSALHSAYEDLHGHIKEGIAEPGLPGKTSPSACSSTLTKINVHQPHNKKSHLADLHVHALVISNIQRVYTGPLIKSGCLQL